MADTRPGPVRREQDSVLRFPAASVCIRQDRQQAPRMPLGARNNKLCISRNRQNCLRWYRRKALWNPDTELVAGTRLMRVTDPGVETRPPRDAHPFPVSAQPTEVPLPDPGQNPAGRDHGKQPAARWQHAGLNLLLVNGHFWTGPSGDDSNVLARIEIRHCCAIAGKDIQRATN